MICGCLGFGVLGVLVYFGLFLMILGFRLRYWDFLSGFWVIFGLFWVLYWVLGFVMLRVRGFAVCLAFVGLWNCDFGGVSFCGLFGMLVFLVDLVGLVVGLRGDCFGCGGFVLLI